MHLIIVEDLAIDREDLADMIREDCARHGETADISFYGSGEDFLAHYRPRSCGGLFLDILLGGVTGMDAARKVRETEPHLPIIFTTTERDYAADSYDIHALDYLVKPVMPERLAWCMERLREYASVPSTLSLLETSAWGHASPVDVPFDEILYGRYGNHIVDVHTTRGVFCTRQSFQEFTAQLPHTGRFQVCGRGLAVNLSQVARVEDGALLLQNGERLAFSRRRRQEIMRAYTEWVFACTRKGFFA